MLTPAAWGLYVFVGWFLVPVACSRDLKAILHLFAAGALTIAAAGLASGVRAVHEDGSVHPFLVSLGVMLSGLFVVRVLLGWTFNVFIDRSIAEIVSAAAAACSRDSAAPPIGALRCAAHVGG